MQDISFILFAYNEESRISYALRNLRPYGEVYVLDAGSTDKTKEITEQFGGHYCIRPKSDKVYFETPEMFSFVKSIIETDWLFWGYVDNLLPKTLLQKMIEIAVENRYKYVYVPIDTYMWGNTEHEVIRASYPNFFHKEHIDFTGNRIHGIGNFIGDRSQILHLPQQKEFSIRHYSLYDLSKFVTGHLRYAIAEAEDKRVHGKKFSVTYMVGSMGHYFWLFYKRGRRAGVQGLYGALLYVFFRLMVAVKLYELEHGLDLEVIEAAFRKDKERVVSEIENI